ncbi:MAG TPA: DUF6429 family protein [Beijerinckia sp.]|nr:DUF6429 family protein [Beijerinckia sp.]
MVLDKDKIDDAILALLLLGLHDESRVWKGFDWDSMKRLHERGLIGNPIGKMKSVIMTKEGQQKASDLLQTLFAKEG